MYLPEHNSDAERKLSYKNCSIIKSISLISIGMAIVIAYLSLTLIYSSYQNFSEIELRKSQIRERQNDLEEEERLDSVELDKLINKELDVHKLRYVNSKPVSRIILFSGFFALSAGCLQFLSSLILHFLYTDDDKDTAQFWSAISIGVFLCLATCLVLILCLDTTQVPYYTQEIVFICFVTVDVLFSMYTIWVILSSV